MKQTKLWLATIAVLWCSLSASAHDFEVGGIYYYIISSTDLTVAVTYRGSSYDSYSNEYSGTDTIPSTVTYNNNTYSVTSIGGYAFYGCSSLTSITIPEGVTSIGEYAFRGCYGLESITIPESVTSIGEYAFRDCSSLTAITIPEGVTSIGYYAFCDCSSLTSITIPESVTSIGSGAFYDCSSLTSITIPSSVTSIGSSAFRGCSSLTSITIPESVVSIGEYAFSGCSGLNSISIPGNVISIGNDAFSDCSGLKEVIFLDGNETLSLGCNDYVSSTNKGYGAFCDCPLENIYIGRDLSYKTLYNEQGYSPFSLCRYLDSVTIGNKVTFLSNYMFYGCRITSLHISSIEAWCNIQFYSNPLTCAQNFYLNGEPVTNLIIPNTVSEIKRNAFSDCGSLTSITIPESVTSIGEYAFSGCI